jgi:hypothetical protein
MIVAPCFFQSEGSSGALAWPLLRAFDAEARNALLRQLECELAAYVRDDGLEVPFQSFLAVARV